MRRIIRTKEKRRTRSRQTVYARRKQSPNRWYIAAVPVGQCPAHRGIIKADIRMQRRTKMGLPEVTEFCKR